MEKEERMEPLSSTHHSLMLLSAFLSMEPTDSLISFARKCGGGSITAFVQNFILEHCINKVVDKCNAPANSYIKFFLKKVIVAIEASGDEVLSGLYEQYGYFLTSYKDDVLLVGNTRVYKRITFLFPSDFSEDRTSTRLVVPLQCSLNMLQGDTGCSIWPSSFYLSEFILSYPEIFSNKSCFEVGSGVGLVGIVLTHVNASKVVLSDGDLLSLANLKHNLELNQISTDIDGPKSTFQRLSMVECKNLLWESASDTQLQNYNPDIVLGADVLYDRSCFPSLIRVLSILLNPWNVNPRKSCCNGLCKSTPISNTVDGNRICDSESDDYIPDTRDDKICGCTRQGQPNFNYVSKSEYVCAEARKYRVGYIATAIRSVDTFNYFLRLADEAHLSVVDITETRKPFNLLPYMKSYNRSSIRLYAISHL